MLHILIFCLLASVCNETMTSTVAPCKTYTSGGNGNGSVCAFPYVYRGIQYYNCIDILNNGVLWCATTYNYDADRIWGNCICKLSFSCQEIKSK